MTYCVAIRMDAGLCFVSDSRTNAGLDNVSTYSKMYAYGIPNERQLVVLSSGNLATTQAVIGQIKKDVVQGATDSFCSVQSLEEAADYVGMVSLEQQAKHTGGGKSFEASFIIGGQIQGGKHAAFLIYPQGNHITTSRDTSFLQIGESKYGKPILDRIINQDIPMETAALSGLVSMDSTMRSNLSVGPPIEVLMYYTDSLVVERRYRFEESSEYLRQLNSAWDNSLREAFGNMPPIAWSQAWDKIDNASGK
ncbi:MAG: peptidase [Gammaproteobacteria bacterium]|jgi:putative proteasome-type protease|nr:peptidase [Gammaproteobacteria bacterium]MBT5202344.1 peptidase [Gammaproteobacteria bacterium]MBT5601710.1 peptidase [Gammaproteobacteria bacterium]MBT6245603.1 peptidase [Gammaproteobacteria bacterium]